MFVLPLPRGAALAARRVVPAHSLVDRLFDESFDRYFGGRGVGAASRTPAMDVSESDAAYTLAFDVPGATRESLKVSVEGRRVTLSTVSPEAPAVDGDAKPAAADAKTRDRALYRERVAPSYARVVSLPAEVDQAASRAKFENGVLTLTLAKKITAGATQLSIA